MKLKDLVAKLLRDFIIRKGINEEIIVKIKAVGDYNDEFSFEELADSLGIHIAAYMIPEYERCLSLSILYDEIVILEGINEGLEDPFLLKEEDPQMVDFLTDVVKDFYGDIYCLKLKLGGIL